MCKKPNNTIWNVLAYWKIKLYYYVAKFTLESQYAWKGHPNFMSTKGLILMHFVSVYDSKTKKLHIKNMHSGMSTTTINKYFSFLMFFLFPFPIYGICIYTFPLTFRFPWWSNDILLPLNIWPYVGCILRERRKTGIYILCTPMYNQCVMVPLWHGCFFVGTCRVSFQQ